MKAAADQPDQADEPKRAAWHPKKPATLVGVFEGWDTGTDRDGRAHLIALIRNDEGRLFEVWTYYVVLRKALDRIKPREGDRVQIERLGECKSTKGHKYIMYRVEILSRAESDGLPPRSDEELEGGER